MALREQPLIPLYLQTTWYFDTYMKSFFSVAVGSEGRSDVVNCSPKTLKAAGPRLDMKPGLHLLHFVLGWTRYWGYTDPCTLPIPQRVPAGLHTVASLPWVAGMGWAEQRKLAGLQA